MTPALRQLLDDYAAAGVYARWALEDWDGAPVVAFYFHDPDGDACDHPHLAASLLVVLLELHRWADARQRRGHPSAVPMRAALTRYQQTAEPPPALCGSP